MCVCQIGGIQGWDKGIDYVRMDGSTSAQNRREWAEMFNDPENSRYVYVLCWFVQYKTAIVSEQTWFNVSSKTLLVILRMYMYFPVNEFYWCRRRNMQQQKASKC